jgi:hypothetical protein
MLCTVGGLRAILATNREKTLSFLLVGCHRIRSYSFTFPVLVPMLDVLQLCYDCNLCVFL